MITLYDYVLSGNCYKVRLLASLLEIEYEAEPIDFHPGKAHRTTEFKRLNPLAELPVLRDGDEIIRDAQAILVHLATRYDSSGSWYPIKKSGQVQQWLSFADTITRTASAARLHDMIGYRLDIDAARRGAHVALRVLDDHLTNRELLGKTWLVGDRPTVADIACFPYVALSRDGGISLDDYGAIRHWLTAVRSLDRFVSMPGIAPLL